MIFETTTCFSWVLIDMWYSELQLTGLADNDDLCIKIIIEIINESVKKFELK